MITRTAPRRQARPWQRILAEAVNDPGELLELLAIDPRRLPPALSAHRQFRLKVPRPFVEKMERGNPEDPLLRQVWCHLDELREAPGFVADPLREQAGHPLPGLLQKYHGRALLVVTGACALHCRYCFRRHFPYGEASGGEMGETLAWLRAESSLREVLLSGGDPLSLPDERLAPLVTALEGIPHLQRLRLHTRLPVVVPQRVDDALLGWIGATRLRVVVVIHVNHPRELDPEVGEALNRLASTGATLLNQSVLLRGVNDSVDCLAELSERLFERGVLPYYLHQLDPVAGAVHFEVPVEEGKALMEALRARLPGYLVPRLVREEAGSAAKIPIL